MVCAPVPSIIPSLKLGDYLSVQAHKPCCISQLFISKEESVYILERETVFAKLLLMILVGSSRSLVVI